MILVHTSPPRSASTWMEAVLLGLAEQLSLRCEPRGPDAYLQRFRSGGLADDTVHPAVFLPWDALGLERCRHPWRVFHVRRDPRDILVSRYYSVKFSHATNPGVATRRDRLLRCSREEGMLWLVSLHAEIFEILRSYVGRGLGDGCMVVEYADLVARPRKHLRAMLGFAGWSLPWRNLRDLVRARSFERLSGGRKRGQEDPYHHFRKGVPGEWRTAFTPRLEEAFKARWGGALVELGYERDLDW